jgi:tetratricopeptide (TPR) repeat protein
MPRWVPLALLACVLPLSALQFVPPAPPPQPPQPPPGELKKDRKPAKTSDKEEVPPEEDTSLSKQDISFNPLQSVKEISAGDFYFKKHRWVAAMGRYKSATLYNEGNAEAWLKLGEASEKLKDRKAAQAAYSKYLEVASDAKNAAEIRKKLDKLK